MDERIEEILGTPKDSEVEYLYSFGDRMSMEMQPRFVKWGDDELERAFGELPIYEQQMVIQNILTLTNRVEFFGFNLEQVMKLYSKTTPKIPQTCIAYMMKAYYDQICEDYKGSDFDEEQGKDWQETLSKQLHRFYKTRRPRLNKDKEKAINLRLVEFICVCLGIDMNVVSKGRGEYYLYQQGISADELFEAWKEVDRECNLKIKNSKKPKMEYIDIRSVYERCHINYEVKYSVIKYSGCYQILRHISDKTKKRAVDQLIKDLQRKQK